MSRSTQIAKFRSCAKKSKGKPNYRKNMSACLRKWFTLSAIDDEIKRLEQELASIEAVESRRTSTAKSFTVDSNYIDSRNAIQSQLNSLYSLKGKDYPTNIKPSTINQLGEPLQKNLGPVLLIGGLVIGAILLRN